MDADIIETSDGYLWLAYDIHGSGIPEWVELHIAMQNEKHTLPDLERIGIVSTAKFVEINDS